MHSASEVETGACILTLFPVIRPIWSSMVFSVSLNSTNIICKIIHIYQLSAHLTLLNLLFLLILLILSSSSSLSSLLFLILILSSSSSSSISFSTLVPYTWYTFSVLARTGAVGGNLYSAPRLFRTLQALPSSVNLNLLALNHTSLLVSWTQPNCTNGVLTGYMVRETFVI